MTPKKPVQPKKEPIRWQLVKVREITKSRLAIAAPHMEMNVQELLDKIATDYLNGLEKFFPTYPERLRPTGAEAVTVPVEEPPAKRRARR